MRKLIYACLACLVSLSTFAQLIPQENEKGKFGFVNGMDEFVIKAQWDDVGNFSNEGIAWVKKGNLYGFIDQTGKYVVKPKYTSIDAYNEFNLCKVSVGGSEDKDGNLKGAKYGFIDRNAREIIKPQYSFTGPFDKNGVCWVNIGGKINEKTGKITGGKYGYVQNSGIELTKIEYTNVRSAFSASGFAWVQKGIQYGYIDIKGRPVTEVKYDAVQDTFYNEMAGVKIKKLYGYVSTTGKEIPAKYIYTESFEDGLGLVAVNPMKGLPKFGYVNMNGQEVVPTVYDDAQDTFSEGFSAVKKDGKWAIVDSNGKLLTGFDYGTVREFKNGLAPVSLTGYKAKVGAQEINHFATWGLINKEGQLVVPYKYLSVEAPDENGFRMVSTIIPSILQLRKNKEQIEEQIEEQTKERINKNNVENKAQLDKWIGEKNSILFNSFLASHNYRTSKIYSAIGRQKAEEIEKIMIKEMENTPKNYPQISPEKQGIGWINSKGEEVIPLMYKDAVNFSDGLAMVKTSLESGFMWINAKNKIVLKTDFQTATPFHNGISCVLDPTTKMWGGINKRGEVIVPFLLSDAKEVVQITAKRYNPQTEKRLTLRDVTLFNLYKYREQDKYKITDVIPNNMWDF